MEKKVFSEKTSEARNADLDDLEWRSLLETIEKKREQARKNHELLRKFQDSESKVLTLERQIQDKDTEIARLKADNDRQQNLLANYLQNPTSQNEAVLQHEVHRLTHENLDLREKTDKLQDQVRLLKRHPKAYQEKLQTGDNFEGSMRENGRDSFPPVDLVPSIRKKDRDYLGMLEYQTGDESKICRALIWDLNARIAAKHLPGLPAYIVFMCIRYTDHLNDENKVRSLLTDAITVVKKLMRNKGESDMNVSVLWLSNVLRLLHTLKQYSGDAMFQNDNTPKQNEQSLKNFDLSEYRPALSDIAEWIYKVIIKLLEDKIQLLIVPAILDNDYGRSQATVADQGSTSSASSEPGAGGVESKLDELIKHLDETDTLLQSFGLDPAVIQQVFRQLFYYICAGALNNLLLRKDLCHWSKGMQISYNISKLEEWCREKKMNLEVVASLQPIIQASQLLQASKTEKDVNSLCEMCGKLTINQIVKLLNSYTPAGELEERLPMSVIRLVQNRLQEIRRSSELSNPQAGTGSSLLMDTKFSFAVKFPFNPSNIRLEDIEIPEPFNISHLVKRI